MSLTPQCIFAIVAILAPSFGEASCDGFRSGFETLTTEASVRYRACGIVIPDTGFATCGNASSNTQPCPQAGFPNQDAEVGRDADATAGTLVKVGGGAGGLDYTKLDAVGNDLAADASSWSCVRDNTTGLVWELKQGKGLHRATDRYGWLDSNPATNGGDAGTNFLSGCEALDPNCNSEAFLAAINGQAVCGRVDWRLPRLQEIHSILYFNISGFGNVDETYLKVVGSTYWTSETSASRPERTFAIDTIYGSLQSNLKDWQGFVIGASGDSNDDAPGRYVVPSDGTVLDTLTGLQWTKCVQGLTGEDCLDGSVSLLNWQSALQTADTSDQAGYTDWRLPNIRELASLILTTRPAPYIASEAFPNTPTQRTWTSTPSAGFGDRAWVVEHGNPGSTFPLKSDLNAVRLVREFVHQ